MLNIRLTVDADRVAVNGPGAQLVRLRLAEPRCLLDVREGAFRQRKLELGRELGGERPVGTPQTQRELSGMIKGEPRRASYTLEGAEIGGGEDEVEARRPHPPPTHRRTCDSRERNDKLAHRLDLLVRADLHADAVGGPRDTPLDLEPIAVEAQ